MFSDLSCDTLLCDIPFDAQPHEDPLAPRNFDDLLDIAREFEFTSTITHIWPCEESSPCSETGLDDIFAVIMPIPDTEALPSPPSPVMQAPSGHAHLDAQRATTVHPHEKASPPTTSEPLLNDSDQVGSEGEYPITSTLRGWSPPNGSQFLDLDGSFMLPESVTDAWLSPWLSPLLSPSYAQQAMNSNQASVKAQELDDSPPATESKAQPISIADAVADSTRRDAVAATPGPRANPEPSQERPTPPTNPRKTVTTPHAKTTKYRVRLHSAPQTGGPCAPRYTKAPRGGIPPRIARTVTKVHFLRIEKERKVMQDAFSNTDTGEGKKPSVLRKAAGAENMGGEGRGNGAFGLQGDTEKKGRIKRARV